jgi:hypothetical protein
MITTADRAVLADLDVYDVRETAPWPTVVFAAGMDGDIYALEWNIHRGHYLVWPDGRQTMVHYNSDAVTMRYRLTIDALPDGMSRSALGYVVAIQRYEIRKRALEPDSARYN